MRIAVVAPEPVPVTWGGAERAWAGLHAALLDAGHDAEVVKLPVREQTLAEVATSYRAFADLDLSPFDLVISSKYPAWMARHPRHVLWLFHPLRGLYDTYHLFGLPLAPTPAEAVTRELVAAVGQPARRGAVPQVLDRVDAAVAALGADHPDLALPGPVSRLVVRWLDRVALDPAEMSRHVALSRTIASRTDYLPPGVAPRVAYAPSDLGPAPTRHRPGAVPHLFTASRLDGPKRLDLVVRAMAHVPGDLPLLIGGTGPEEERLRALAAGDPRIRFLGFVPDEDLPGLYAGARAVPFVPLDEDYGLIAVEAMAAGVPVVTCTDSGGPTELVHDGVNGRVVDPDPVAVGRALAELVADPRRAGALGDRARHRAARITWAAVVRTLLGPARPAGGRGPRTPDRATPRAGASGSTLADADRGDGRATPGRGPQGTGGSTPRQDRAGPATRRRRTPGRPRVVALTTFRVADRGHGGQLRAYHLYGALAEHADVEIVSLTDGGTAGSTELRPGLVETAVPRTAAHQGEADRRTLAVGLPVSDLVAGSAIELTPDYLSRLREAARDADVAILAEPYLLPALDRAGLDLPVVYDAYNVEADLKADVLPPGPAGTAVYREVCAVERAAVERAVVVTACSDEDADRLTATAGRPRRDAVVIPNGTDPGAVRYRGADGRRARGERWLDRYRSLDPRARAVRSLALFLGSWHPPNLAAAEILLALAPEVPDVLFVLGGRHGDAFAGRPTPANLVFTGVVSDRAKDALLDAAHLALNPMIHGSGTNLKIVEYLAAGAPVVSTPFGVRGLAVTSGQHLLVAEVADLGAAVRQVVDDPAGAARRAAAGRALVEATYSWDVLGRRLAEVVRGIAVR